MYRKCAFLMMFCCLALWARGDESGQSDAALVQHEYTREDYPVQGESVVALAGRKFARGLTNVVTGTGEIPRQMIISYRDDGPALFFPMGLTIGLFMTIARTGYGAVETVAFIMPFEGTYNSLLTPDYAWGPLPPPKDVSAKPEKKP